MLNPWQAAPSALSSELDGALFFLSLGMENQGIGTCNHCGQTWVVYVRAEIVSAASNATRQGDRCPFCQSNNVSIRQEKTN